MNQIREAILLLKRIFFNIVQASSSTELVFLLVEQNIFSVCVRLTLPIRSWNNSLKRIHIFLLLVVVGADSIGNVQNSRRQKQIPRMFCFCLMLTPNMKTQKT